ncbi:MAG: zinc-dependent metalloprotease, partial [Elusimicrobiota bacterium]
MDITRALAVALIIAAPAAAQQAAAPELTDAGRPSAQSVRRLSDAQEAARGLFDLVEKDGHYQLVLQKAQLNKPYLLSGTISRGLGAAVHSGDYEGQFLIAFRRVGKIVEVYHLNTEFRAAPGTPEAAGVKSSYPDSLIAAVAISTEDARAGYMMISAEGIFLADITDVAATVARAFKIPAPALKAVGGVTRIDKAAAYHSNIEIDASFVYHPETAVPVQSETLPDSRMLTVGVHYSLAALPDDKGFDERPADPRVGFFTTKFRDYSAARLKDVQDPVDRVVNHWRLEKSVPDAPVSDVKKPIVWWLDEAMPEQYRGAVKAGILAWNEAFEAVGLRNALVVKEVDKDMSPEERARFSPADASYNMVRWFLDPQAGMSYGPSRTNPLTGEIYSATVMLSDNMSRLWEMLYKPELAAGIDADVRPDPAQLAALSARGLTDADKNQVLQEYISNVINHEIGHTLGLSHNFKGSQLLRMSEMGKDGLMSSSIMDYVPINLPLPGMPKVYFQTKPGPYDLWAIEYGYKPMPADPAQKAAALKSIARRSDSDPKLAFALDTDVRGIDPDAQRFDFSSEPLVYAETLIKRADALWSRAASADVPERVPPAATALHGGVGFYNQAASVVLPLIGGVRSDRRPTDEGGTRLRPVPAAEQRAALDFLDRRVFAAGAFAVPPELELRAASNPAEAPAGGGLPDVGYAALSIQREALDHLYDPATLRRLSTAERFDPKTAFKMSE